jgi:hypothetical protein
MAGGLRDQLIAESRGRGETSGGAGGYAGGYGDAIEEEGGQEELLWQAVLDPEGRTYYANLATGESTWTRPEGFGSILAQSAMAAVPGGEGDDEGARGYTTTAAYDARLAAKGAPGEAEAGMCGALPTGRKASVFASYGPGGSYNPVTIQKKIEEEAPPPPPPPPQVPVRPGLHGEYAHGSYVEGTSASKAEELRQRALKAASHTSAHLVTAVPKRRGRGTIYQSSPAYPAEPRQMSSHDDRPDPRARVTRTASTIARIPMGQKGRLGDANVARPWMAGDSLREDISVTTRYGGGGGGGGAGAGGGGGGGGGGARRSDVPLATHGARSMDQLKRGAEGNHNKKYEWEEATPARADRHWTSKSVFE